MRRDVTGGILLIAGSLVGVMVLSLHPTGRDLLTSADASRQALLSMMVHALALAGLPMLFLGQLGLARRLGSSHLTTSALVVYGFGGVAVLSAAVVSGFVSTPITQRILAAEGPTREMYKALLMYSGLLNHGFANVSVVASSAAILLWSVAIIRSKQMTRAVGFAGIVVSTGVLLAFLSGHLGLDVHGFGLITFAQSAWMIWLGILLCRATGSSRPE